VLALKERITHDDDSMDTSGHCQSATPGLPVGVVKLAIKGLGKQLLLGYSSALLMSTPLVVAREYIDGLSNTR